MLLTPSIVPVSVQELSKAPEMLAKQVNAVVAGFEVPGILFGSVCLLLILMVHGTFMTVVHRTHDSWAEKSLSAGNYWCVEILFYVGMLVMMLGHIVEIGLWAWFLNMSHLATNYHDAMVFSGSTYTTVGYGQDILPRGWEILTVVIALSGMFTFAWTTSLMIILMNTYRAARIARRTGILPEEYRKGKTNS